MFRKTWGPFHVVAGIRHVLAPREVFTPRNGILKCPRAGPTGICNKLLPRVEADSCEGSSNQLGYVNPKDRIDARGTCNLGKVGFPKHLEVGNPRRHLTRYRPLGTVSAELTQFQTIEHGFNRLRPREPSMSTLGAGPYLRVAIGVCCDVSRRVAYSRLGDLVWLVFVGRVSLFASVSFHFSTDFSIIDACTKVVVGRRGEVSP
ncbi:hypothetical protein BHE74_00002708 [Ensete ventricosum]|nr:hypothetical protein BHE74_00002708 [Ensete ventricosum]